MNFELMHSAGLVGGPECSVGDPERRRLKLKHTWQLTLSLYVLLQIMNSRLPAGSTNFVDDGG